MSREVVAYEPGRELADYAPDADIVVSRADLAALADGGDDRQLDRAARQACEGVLRQYWGSEYEQRIAINFQVLEMQFGKELAIDLLEARMPDGRRIADEPTLSAGLSELIVLAAQAINQGASRSSVGRLEQIREIMKTDFGRYVREGLGNEYARLLETDDQEG